MATKTIKLRGFMTVYNSRRDINGNCYFAWRYTDAESGLSAERVLGGSARGNSDWEKNQLLRSLAPPLPWDSNLSPDSWEAQSRGELCAGEVRIEERELPIREFNRLTKTWTYGTGAPLDFLPALPKRFHSRIRRWVVWKKLHDVQANARREADLAKWRDGRTLGEVTP